MNIVLFDTSQRTRLYPLTLTRSVADIRIGIFTINERWERLTNSQVFILTESFLQPLYDEVPGGDTLFINATILPNADVVTQILNLEIGEYILQDNAVIAGRKVVSSPIKFDSIWTTMFHRTVNVPLIKQLEYPHQISQWNDEFLRYDFALVTKDRASANPDETNHVYNSSQVFVEEGAKVSCCVLNASTGPIYIGKEVNIMEGSLLRGPLAICAGAVVKMGAKIYGATTIGPGCVAGGEIKNSVFFANSNKAHDGYVGDSVIGEWCNMGAGTSNSNVKNNGGDVKQWNCFYDDYISAGNKCGVVMGDHSRTAINTSINTGTIVGVCCNVFGQGLTPKVIRNFSWGADGKTRYQLEKALADISNWKKMKHQTTSNVEANVLKHIFENNL